MRIKVDMDETICYLLQDWVGRYNLITKEEVDSSQIFDWDLFKYVREPERLENLLHCQHLFEALQPVEGAIEALEEMNRSHEIVIVSDAQGDHEIITGKLNWVKENLPFIDCRRQVVFTCEKNLIQADMIIDDGPFILDSEEYYRLLVDRPYNRGLRYLNDHTIKRVYNWKDIYEEVKSIEEEERQLILGN